MKNQNISFFYGIIIMYMFSSICKMTTCWLLFFLTYLKCNASIITLIVGSMLIGFLFCFFFMKKTPSIKLWFFILVVGLLLFSNSYLSTRLTILIRDSDFYTQDNRSILYGIQSSFSSVIYFLVIIISFIKYYILKNKDNTPAST
jgi:hypothetical protein